MTENVGRTEQIIRGAGAVALLAVGYTALGAREGRLPGLLTLVAGAIVLETAVSRVCPLSAAIGIDTRTSRERLDDLRRAERAALEADRRGIGRRKRDRAALSP